MGSDDETATVEKLLGSVIELAEDVTMELSAVARLVGVVAGIIIADKVLVRGVTGAVAVALIFA